MANTAREHASRVVLSLASGWVLKILSSSRWRYERKCIVQGVASRRVRHLHPVRRLGRAFRFIVRREQAGTESRPVRAEGSVWALRTRNAPWAVPRCSSWWAPKPGWPRRFTLTSAGRSPGETGRDSRGVAAQIDGVDRTGFAKSRAQRLPSRDHEVPRSAARRGEHTRKTERGSASVFYAPLMRYAAALAAGRWPHRGQSHP